MEDELIKHLAELNDKYHDVKAENMRLKGNAGLERFAFAPIFLIGIVIGILITRIINP